MSATRNLIAFAALASSSFAFAADGKGAGKWTIDGDVQGYPIHDVCTLSGPDTKLTGTCTMDSKDRETTGTFDGTTLTLKHPGEYNGDALTITYTGKLQKDGTISGDIDVQPMSYSGTFTAARPASTTPAPKPQ
ncbi:hypothetical protein [Terriglobus aquaticus]|uniref:Uncharacterized protein n=1 Tax=Terriglobus aquaticus TaxID=940139 RepID=A0ABW9KJA8_9BACT|nr:hypothetical protein [Terriglobus aquaticus]